MGGAGGGGGDTSRSKAPSNPARRCSYHRCGGRAAAVGFAFGRAAAAPCRAGSAEGGRGNDPVEPREAWDAAAARGTADGGGEARAPPRLCRRVGRPPPVLLSPPPPPPPPLPPLCKHTGL
jgi:hypothetical protein